MENQQITSVDNPLDNFFDIALDGPIRSQIKRAAVWAKVSALCSFIGYLILFATTILGLRKISGDMENGMPIIGFGFGNIIGMLIMMAIAIIVNYFLYRFAASTARGMDSMDSIATNRGFNSLRIYFRIVGILIIVGLSIFVLFIFFAIIGAATRA